MRHLLSISELSDSALAEIIARGRYFASEPKDTTKTLQNRVIGIYFRSTSTRTRVSFTVAAIRLGADYVALGPHDLQTNTGECLEDTGSVLSQYLDALVVRTASDSIEQELLAKQSDMAVINAMSADEHPTQAIADLITMDRHFGSLEGLKVLYVGEGNNTATALTLAMSRIRSAKLTLLTPSGYGIPERFHALANGFASVSGAVITEVDNMDAAPTDVDVVYTTRWQTTGTSKGDRNWRATFRPFSVSKELMSRVANHSRAVFMHDLPAVRGEDVDADVLEGSQSIAFQQARNKLSAAMAVFEYCLLK